MKNIFIDKNLLNYIDNYKILCSKIKFILTKFKLNIHINIVLINNLDELSHILNTNVPNWVIGANKENDIFILNPSLWKNKDISSVEEVILHEVTHVILNSINSNCPLWLNEGLAIYFSNQYKDIINNTISNIKNPYNLTYDDDLYFYSAIVVYNLIKIYSEETIISKIKKVIKFTDDPILGVNSIDNICNNYNFL